jgi:hypothetical protein
MLSRSSATFVCVATASEKHLHRPPVAAPRSAAGPGSLGSWGQVKLTDRELAVKLIEAVAGDYTSKMFAHLALTVKEISELAKSMASSWSDAAAGQHV